MQTFRNEIGVYRSVMADPRCPRLPRRLLGGAIAYALSPIDLIPDFIPVLGHLDDLLILPVMIWLAIRAIPKELVEEHRDTPGEGPGVPSARTEARRGCGRG